MKFFVVLALAAVALAEPEADPAYYYTNGVVTYKSHVPPAVKTVATAPVAYYNPAMYYNYYNPYVIPTVKAAEPVAEPVAEPEVKTEEVVEAKTEAVAPVAPLVYNVPHLYAPYVAAPYVAAPTVVKAAPAYYATSAPGVVHQVAKREAEAEADPAYYYAGYPYAAYPYASAYGLPYRYGAYAAYPYTYGYRFI